MLLQLSDFSPSLFSSTLHPHLHPPPPPCLSLCPWVIHITSLASPFPKLFLTFPCPFCTYHLCFLFSVPFPLILLLPLPTDNLPCYLHFCDSVPILVCLIFVFVFLGSVVDSFEFIVILLFTGFDLLLFLI